MLWYKAWLEMRWRVVFLVGSILLVWFSPLWIQLMGMRVPAAALASRIWIGVHLGSVLLCIFAAIYLAGSGVNTQTTYAATSGFHGSMLFTLSLPVSRRRLLSVRAGMGAILTCCLVVILAWFTILQLPQAATASQASLYIARAIVCTMAVYALSILLACILDEMWQFMSACLLLSAVYMLQTRFALIAQLSPLRGMSLISYPLTAAMPWAPVLTSVAITATLLGASVLILQRKEY